MGKGSHEEQAAEEAARWEAIGDKWAKDQADELMKEIEGD